MIKQIKNAIAEAYHSAYPTYTIRDEEIPSGFKKPTFVIMVYDFEYKQTLGDRYTGTLYFDDLYFSTASATGIKSDLLSVQQTITRAFTKLNGFKAIRQTCDIVDNVLHHKYRIKYKELRKEDVDKINTMLISIKERSN